MSPSLPSILIVANDPVERAAIASLVDEAGMRPVVAGPDEVALLRPAKIAGAVVALPDAAAREFLRHAAVLAPRAKIAMLSDAHAMPFEDARVVTVKRPLDARELIGAILDLMLREDAPEPAARHGLAAELSIAAAKLKCLCKREASATVIGAGRLMYDVSAQIADIRTGRAAPMLPAGAD